MGVKFHRRISPKVFLMFGVGLTVLLCLYYVNCGSGCSSPNGTAEALQRHNADALISVGRSSNDDAVESNNGNNGKERTRAAILPENKVRERVQCLPLEKNDADVNTVEVFKGFDFQPGWMKMKEYWDKQFEDRFEKQKMDADRPPLKVIIVPHSHNDPGWLKTFENYFHYQSRPIMSNMVTKLQQYKNLTFIWSEVAFLNAWWEVAHPSKQRALRSLAQSGRLEITTGGWVMTDEANAHMYAIIDQLIEGHQWLHSNLGIKPKSGWSIDPFGHGSTVPYLLKSSGIEGTVIQRIHYAWKQWLAWKQYGDFRWQPNWAPSDSSAHILTHNQPFDIYSIKHSCGPHPYVCLNFDFRKVPGEFTEYSVKAQNITEHNIKEKAELLLEQYSRTGSLFTHNVVLMPLGDDFRYNVVEEWDQQYYNYMKLINYINDHKHIYKTEIAFGTPRDYFESILNRTKMSEFPSLQGDFFVYSDIFSEGRPAYWSGYFTTRPFMKILDRELENSLRASEILYTLAINGARQKKLLPHLKVLERDYEKLVIARRNLGLFQHHDAITGTSKSFVMRDYGLKLFESLRDTVKIQQNALQTIIFGTESNTPLKTERNILLSDLERDAYEKLPKKTVIVLEPGKNRKLVLFNSVAQEQNQLVQVRINTFNVKVYDNEGKEVAYQINPVWNGSDGNTKMHISDDEYELVFVAKIPGFGIVSYNLVHAKGTKGKMALIYCNKCHRKQFQESSPFLPTKFLLKNTQNGDVQLENLKLRILFNGLTGFMKSVTRKNTKKTVQCGIQFAAYRSAQFHSGAYLFMPDPSENDIEKDVLQQYREQMSIIITSGGVSSDISIIYGPFLVHTVRIFHVEALSDAIWIENEVDFENPPKNRETELFMRLVTEVQNGEPPEFYTDSNGFSMQRRIKIDRIGIEGNYFPITTQAFIQDENLRISLLTNHAQGAASWQPGFLEVMLDRRTLYDDSRGMGEGVVDNRKTTHKFWLLLEDVVPTPGGASPRNRFDDYETVRNFNINPGDTPDETLKSATNSRTHVSPSLYSNHLSHGLNYPYGVFILEDTVELNDTTIQLADEIPCDVHVVTLRTQPDPVYTQFPANNALFVLHREGYACNVNINFTCPKGSFHKGDTFGSALISEVQKTSLTGLDKQGQPFKEFSGIEITSMGIQTYNITFA